MAVTTLWLTDFRCFTEAEIRPHPEGLTVLRGTERGGEDVGARGRRVGWPLQRSIRGAPA